jgi:hypothetical protein
VSMVLLSPAVIALSSTAGDGVAETTLVMARCLCQGNWAAAQCHCRVIHAMSLSR